MIKIYIMKILILFVLMSSIIALSGCISNPEEVSEQSNNILENEPGVLPQDMHFNDTRAMNMSDAERQQLMEERKHNLSDMGGRGMQDNISGRPSNEAMQQKLLDACNGKNEGDSCKFTGPHGEETGTCIIQQDHLTCTPEGFKGDI